MFNGSLYRLADSTAAEPLINRWVAWSHLVPPVPASLHLKSYQIELLKSYLQDPHFHAQACCDRKLRSGQFVNIPPERLDDARQLLKNTEQSLSDNLELAGAVMEFQNYIAGRARGQGLDSFYEKLPRPLLGYVELVYDYYNHPIVRFLEPLLYESRYYKPELQSLNIFAQLTDNSRSFIMNTPRLAESDHIDWSVPFDSPDVDEFFKLDYAPRPLGHIRELLGLGADDDASLRRLLTEDPATPRLRWQGPTARLTYFGHACVLIEWGGVSILTDPNVAVAPMGGGVERNSYRDLPDKIDYAIVTHNHHDHFCLETLLRLRHKIGCLVVPRSSGIFYGDISLKLLARKLGFKQVVEMDTFDSIELPDGEIVAVPFLGEHADLPHSKTAFVVRAGKNQILFGADSDCLDRQVYEHVGRTLGPIETVFLGMECVGAPLSWSCGPFLPARPERYHEKSRRYKGCDSVRAMRILRAIGAKRIFLYAMGMEPWLEHLLGLAYSEDAPQLIESNKLLVEARNEGFIEARLLYGRDEINLTDLPSERRSFAMPRALQPEANHLQATAAARRPQPDSGIRQLEEFDDSGDEFRFG